VGWQLLTSNFYRSGSSISIVASPLPSIEISDSTGQFADVVAVTSYDPFGDDDENSELAPLAIDGDVKTAWTTSSYRTSDMSEKAGVGLLLDLGAKQKVYEVAIEFLSTGHSAEIYVVNSAQLDFATAKKFGDTDPAKSSNEVAVTDPVSGRYVLIWLTPDLPGSDSGKYQGGISEVKVRL
jgi:hypothetical protein